MAELEQIKRKILTGERALYGKQGMELEDCIFEDGESPLKECRGINLRGCMFKWKYPLWYCQQVRVEDSVWFEMARAGVWYTGRIAVTNCAIEAPKNIRRCWVLTLQNVTFSNAAETLWSCDGVTLRNVQAKGDYFAMNSQNINADGLTLFGNYGFDGCKNVTIRNSRLMTKDAFWNCENVTVCDSFISGEYLGWNSKNLTFVNCTIESLQGLCYIDNLTLKNCKLLNTTLAFEYASVDAELDGGVESVLNPTRGTIKADRIGELIVERDRVDPEKTRILCRQIEKQSLHPDWIKE